MFCSRFSLLAMLLLLVAAGCSDSEDATSSVTGSGPESESSDHADHNHDDEEKRTDGFTLEVDRKAEDVAGAWLFYVTQEQNEIPIAMMGVVAKDQQNPSKDDMQAVFLQPTKAGGKLEGGPSTVTLHTVQFQFTRDGQFQLFDGELKDGIIFGNILNAEGRCVPARMVRFTTAVKSEPQPALAEGFFELTDILKDGGDWDQLVSFVEDHPESPLVINALYSLSSQLGPRDPSREKVEQVFDLIEQYVSPWGNRLKQYSRLNSLVSIMNIYRYSDFLESIRSSLEGEFPEPMWEEQTKFVLETMKEEVGYVKQVEALRSSEPETRDEIMKQLHEIREKDIFNFNFIRATAVALESIGEKEKALEWYLGYVSIPGLDSFYLNQFQMYASEVTLTSQKLESLWKEVHGDTEGLSAALEENYIDLLESYELPELSLPEENQKRVLVELFTGTACPPCIASDIAFSHLKQKLPSDRAIFLQYHVHVPAADPLTTDGSTGRYHYYGVSGTPTYFISGRATLGTAGPASIASTTITMLADEIVEELKIEPPLEIDVDLEPTGDGIATFKANVEAEEISERWRLNVVLAEEMVRFKGPNQIPYHEMVVRHVFTPSQGEPPQGKSLMLDGTIDPEKIRGSIDADLEKMRKEYSIEVPNAPLELKNLHLVVFVQDNRNRRVRQAVSVPVPDLSSEKVSSAD